MSVERKKITSPFSSADYNRYSVSIHDSSRLCNNWHSYPQILAWMLIKFSFGNMKGLRKCLHIYIYIYLRWLPAEVVQDDLYPLKTLLLPLELSIASGSASEATSGQLLQWFTINCTVEWTFFFLSRLYIGFFVLVQSSAGSVVIKNKRLFPLLFQHVRRVWPAKIRWFKFKA